MKSSRRGGNMLPEWAVTEWELRCLQISATLSPMLARRLALNHQNIMDAFNGAVHSIETSDFGRFRMYSCPNPVLPK